MKSKLALLMPALLPAIIAPALAQQNHPARDAGMRGE